VLGPKRAIAWRTLDAQYFGVAQRRKRVFLVASARDKFNPASVLFEFDGVRRDSPPSREARQGAAAGVGGGPDGGRIAGTVSSKWSKGSGGPAGDECYNMVAQPVKCATGDITHTLRGVGFDAGEDGTGRGTPLVPVAPLAFKIRGGVEREDGSRGSTNIGKQAGKGYLGSEERAFTLAAAQDQFVAQPVATAMQVRRLTPVECERLQGFPDGYTNIPWRKSPEAPDGPRYKALGNSMAVPCMAWIGKRIAEVDRGD
jgi:DNA (cytosine-5)-methyltransferase 1